jgi:hypothetical protein
VHREQLVEVLQVEPAYFPHPFDDIYPVFTYERNACRFPSAMLQPVRHRVRIVQAMRNTYPAIMTNIICHLFPPPILKKQER